MMKNTYPSCPICGKKADKTCSGCHLVSYCSATHQKEDWKDHRKSCRLYTVKKNDVMGRYLVAARDIPAGTIILSETPFAYGPKQNTRPLCLGCYKLVDGTFLCSKCQFPLCGPGCEKIMDHADNECKVFQRSNLPVKIEDYDKWHPAYECILTVRCLLLRDRDPKKWAALNEMEHHNKIRRETLKELWHRNQMNTVKFLRERYKMTDFDEDTINSVLGYADINSFEIRANGIEICGLYPNIYIMSHDCLSNTHHTVTEDYRMIVRSSVPIKKGELISTAYTHTLDGTLERRQNVKESKFFDCICLRCGDPTELETHFSSIKCLKCTKGYLMPIDSLNHSSNWKCNDCQEEKGVDSVLELIREIKAEMDAIREGQNLIPKLESLLEKHSGKTVHPNHYLLMSISHSLSELYGRTPDWLICWILLISPSDTLSMESLLKKENHCRKLLAVLDVLEPGFTRIRGLTLYELHASLYFIAKAKFQDNLIDPEHLRIELEEVLRLLHEAQYILLFDTSTSSEGVIAKSIPESILSVKLVIEHCCNTP